MAGGQAALRQQDYKAAEQQFEAALEVAEQLPPSDPRLAQSLNNLAAVYYAEKNYARATPLMRRSLELLQQTLGPNDPNVGQTLKNLAALYYLQDDLAAAEPLLKRSLAILEKAYGSQHAYVGTVLSNLASLYVAEGRPTDAEPLLERSLETWQALLGEDHPDVQQSRALLEQVRQSLANPAAAGPSGPAVAPPQFKPTAPGTLTTAEPAGQADEAGPRALTAALTPPASPSPPPAAAASPPAAAPAAPSLAEAGPTVSAPLPGAPAAGPAKGRSFATYLSSLWSRQSAERYWQSLRAQAPDLLADKQLAVQEVAVQEGGAFYRVLAGDFPDSPSADKFCRALRQEVQSQVCEVTTR